MTNHTSLTPSSAAIRSARRRSLAGLVCGSSALDWACQSNAASHLPSYDAVVRRYYYYYYYYRNRTRGTQKESKKEKTHKSIKSVCTQMLYFFYIPINRP